MHNLNRRVQVNLHLNTVVSIEPGGAAMISPLTAVCQTWLRSLGCSLSNREGQHLEWLCSTKLCTSWLLWRCPNTTPFPPEPLLGTIPSTSVKSVPQRTITNFLFSLGPSFSGILSQIVLSLSRTLALLNLPLPRSPSLTLKYQPSF